MDVGEALKKAPSQKELIKNLCAGGITCDKRAWTVPLGIGGMGMVAS